MIIILGLSILLEEIGEACKEALALQFPPKNWNNGTKEEFIKTTETNYRKEMAQVAAVALAIVECIDRKNTEKKNEEKC